MFGKLGARHQHLAVLTTILHRSLLEADLIRAGRVFGMLLRAEMHGESFDIRKQDRWGVGVEVLYLRGPQLEKATRYQTGEDRNVRGASSPQAQRADDRFGPESFPAVKEYFERLVLQYPFRRTTPNAVSSLDFYPAMFSLWIHSIQERHRTAIYAIEHTDNSREEQRSSSSPTQTQQERVQQVATTHDQTLQDVRNVAARLDELLISPPYSDQPRYWKLRAMIALWMSYLMQSSQAHESSLSIEDRGSPASQDPEMGSFGIPGAISKAREAFAKVLDLGASLDDSAQRFLSADDG